MAWKRTLLIVVLAFGLPVYFHLSHKIRELVDSNQLELIDGRITSDLISENSLSVENDNREINAGDDIDLSGNNRLVTGSPKLAGQVRQVILEPLIVFGVIVDEDNLPVADALISDELSGNGTRSDTNGRYRMLVELPKFKIPFLNFLRSGYKGKRIGIPAEEFKNDFSMELNITLVETADTTTLQGWIGNDIGAGLPNLKIRIVSETGMGLGAIYYVVHSDDKGHFSFEGIKSGQTYKLEAYPPPGYSGFVIHVLNITQYTPLLNIVLDRHDLLELRGMVVNREGAPVPNFKMLVKSVSTNFPVQTISTDSSGFFNLTEFPTGEVKFSTLAPEYFRISGLRLDRKGAQNLILVVDKGTYYLSGWVSDQNGIPIENARVTIEASFDDGGIVSYSYRSQYTDNAGAFSFADVGDKSHLITVYAEGLKKTETKHQFNSQSDNIHITVLPN